MVVTLLTILHFVVATLLILFVLIQDSKGDGMGTTFGGGGSNSVLGATGAASLLVKLTRGLVVVFAATSILLTRLTAEHKNSVIDTVGATPTEQSQAAAPAVPAAPAAATVPATATSPEAPKK